MIQSKRIKWFHGEHFYYIDRYVRWLTCNILFHSQVVSYGSDADIARNKEKLVNQLTTIAKSKPPSSLVRLSIEFQPASDSQEGFKDMFGELNKTRDREPTVKVPDFHKTKMLTLFLKCF